MSSKISFIEYHERGIPVSYTGVEHRWFVQWLTGEYRVHRGEMCSWADRGAEEMTKNITQGWQRKAGIFIRTGVFRFGSVKQRRRFEHFLDTGIIVICLSVMIILITYVNIYFFPLSTHSYLACQPILILYVNMYLIHISTWIIHWPNFINLMFVGWVLVVFWRIDS